MQFFASGTKRPVLTSTQLAAILQPAWNTVLKLPGIEDHLVLD
jgi:hypothetical protein